MLKFNTVWFLFLYFPLCDKILMHNLVCFVSLLLLIVFLLSLRYVTIYCGSVEVHAGGTPQRGGATLTLASRTGTLWASFPIP